MYLLSNISEWAIVLLNSDIFTFVKGQKIFFNWLIAVIEFIVTVRCYQPVATYARLINRLIARIIHFNLHPALITNDVCVCRFVVSRYVSANDSGIPRFSLRSFNSFLRGENQMPSNYRMEKLVDSGKMKNVTNISFNKLCQKLRLKDR